MSEVGNQVSALGLGIFKECLTAKENMFGVEIELEHLFDAEYGEVGTWRCVEEGGLGEGGREFVFKEPQTKRQAMNSVCSLFKSFEEEELKPEASGLCGIHIHVNMLNASYLELSNVALCSAILEPMLFHVTGDRCQNRYCIPVMSTKYADLLCQYYSHNRIVKIGSLIGGQPKYCGVNFLTLQQYGTIEYRQMASSTDPDKINSYLLVIDLLVTMGKEKKFLERLLSATINSEIDQICRDVFKQNPPPHIIEEIASNIRYIKMRLDFSVHNIKLSLKG